MADGPSENKDEKKDTCSWSVADEAVLVGIFKKAKEDGLQAENGWKPQVWTLAIEALKGSEEISGGSAKGDKHCKSRWQRLKSGYQMVKKLRDLSGFGWDDERQLVTATSDVWDAYIKSNPKASPWRKKSFHNYEDMAFLVDGAFPTGKGAFRPGRSAQENANAAPALADEQGINVIDPILFNSGSKSAGDAVTPQKRQPSIQDDKDVDEDSPSKKKGRQTGTAAIFALSSSIDSVVSAFTASTDSTAAALTSPQRKTAAIRTAEENEELSDDEMVNVAELFRERTDVADAYLALSKKSTRTAYLHRALAKHSDVF